MNKKLLIIIPIILFVILIVVITCVLDYYKNRENIRKEVKDNLNKNKKADKVCVPFTGGSFTILFNTNGGNEVANISVCIGCAPDTYDDLPIPVRDGYTFDGWYYDKELTKKVEATNTIDITPVADYNEDNCVVGHKNIMLYAKWK